MKKEPIKVVMLPTEKVFDKNINSQIVIHNGTLKFCQSGGMLKESEPQHLYITVSQDVEPIKEGDWCYHINSMEIIKYPKGGFPIGHARKIIATTDSKLLKEHDDSVPIPRMKSTGIAQLQQSFLKEFVANPNGEYEVGYNDTCDVERGQCCCSERDVDCELHSLKLKLNQDNTVKITSVEEKMYSLKQIRLTFQAGSRRGYCQRSIMSNIGATCEEPDEEGWIKENL
tara:strand:+ start:734 stop:1417 length:684 start_codon:yes stop_codon:yes gene_type:complete